MNRRWVMLAGLLAMALLVRWPGLERSLWYDELFTLTHFSHGLGAALTEQVAANNHPLASVLVWLAQAVGAVTERALRLPFWALGGAAAAALAGWSGLIGGRAALLSAALAVLAPFHVLLGQQVRGYAPLLLAVTLLAPAVERALDRGDTRAKAAVVGLTALGIWAHLSAGVLAGAYLIALRWRAGQRRAAAGALAAGIGLGLLLVAPILQRTVKHGGRALLEGDAGAPGRLGAGEVVSWLGGSWALALGIMALAVWGLVRTRRPRALLVAPLATVGLLILVGAPAYPRFLAVALPGVLALAGLGLSHLPGRRGAALGLASCLLLSCGPLWVQRAQELQDYRGAARLARAMTPDGVTLTLQPGSGVLFAPYLGGLGAEVADDLALEAWLAEPAPGVAIDDFPRLTSPDRRRLLVGACGAPLVLPGRVGPVAVYLRGGL